MKQTTNTLRAAANAAHNDGVTTVLPPNHIPRKYSPLVNTSHEVAALLAEGYNF